MSAGIPDVLLERYRLGELPQPEREALERRVAADASARARLEALARSDEEIRGRRLAERIAQEVRARLAASRPAAVNTFSASPSTAPAIGKPRQICTPVLGSTIQW